ncbi:MAG: hypothetical protein ABI433_18340 [Burkholderiaceae bacterium]
MDNRIKTATGAFVLISGLPAVAQESTALKATVPAYCASCPKVINPPGDPTFLIAGAFILGAIVGFAIAKALGNKKR